MSPGRRVLLVLLGGHVFLMASCRAHDDLGGASMVAAESSQAGGDRATKSLFPKRHGRSRKLAKGGGGNGNGVGNGHGGYYGKGGGKGGGNGGGHGGVGGGNDDPIIVGMPPGSGATPGGLRPLCLYTLDPSTDCSNTPSNPQGPPGECTRINFGYDCAYCTRFCPREYNIPIGYELPSYDLGYFGTEINKQHGCEIKNKVADGTSASQLDVTKLGNFCCQTCFLWRETNTNRCPFLLNNNQAQCWVNNDLGTTGAVDGNNPYVRRTDTTQPLTAFSHFLMIPDLAITGVEDRNRNTYDVWSGAWKVYVNPNGQLKRQGTTGPFWSQVNTFPTFRNTGMGVNMASARSQHQMHIHYAPLPKRLRTVLLGGPGFTNPCTTLSVKTAAGNDITFGAYFFKDPFGTAMQTWNPRSLAQGCPQWADVFNPFPLNGIGDLWTRTDLAMASTSMMVVAANSNDGAANVNGYYLLFGNLGSMANRNFFRAEDMLCTPAASDKGYWSKADCTY